MNPEKRWSESHGDRGGTVRIYETGSGILYGVVPAGQGKYREVSLRTKSKDKARRWMKQRAAELALDGHTATADPVPRLDKVLSLYLAAKQAAVSRSQRYHNNRAQALWTNYLGASRDVRTITKADLRIYLKLRMTGAINGSGQHVAELAEREVVAEDTAGADISWLQMVVKFVMAERDPQIVIRERPPLLDFREVEKNPNPKQPVCSQERFLAISEAADGVLMRVWWSRRARLVRSPVRELIELSYYLGTRIGQLVKLRASWLHLEPVPGASEGYILFPGSGKRNKNQKDWEAVLTPESRAIIDKLLVEHLVRGARPPKDYLFAHPYQVDAPMTVDIASEHHELAEQAAHLPHLDAGCWHPYRRAYNTSLMHHNPAVIAASTGRKDVATMIQHYVKPNRKAVHDALLDRRPLRETESTERSTET